MRFIKKTVLYRMLSDASLSHKESKEMFKQPQIDVQCDRNMPEYEPDFGVEIEVNLGPTYMYMYTPATDCLPCFALSWWGSYFVR